MTSYIRNRTWREIFFIQCVFDDDEQLQRDQNLTKTISSAQNDVNVSKVRLSFLHKMPV